MTCLASRSLHLALCLTLSGLMYGCAVAGAGRTFAVSGCWYGAREVALGYSGGGWECER